MWIWKSAQSAFGSWTMVLGMLLGGVSVFNFVQHVLAFDLSALFADILSAYRGVFHTLFDLMTIWIPYEFKSWQKDAAVIWLVLWGALFRILWLIYSAELRSRRKSGWGPLGDTIPLLGDLISRNLLGAVIGFAATIFLWPLILFLMCSRLPHFFRTQDGSLTFAHRATERHPRLQHYLFDVRLLYMIQITMMLAVAASATITNDLIR